MKERPDIGVYVKDLSAFSVNNADDMDRIMSIGNKNSIIKKFSYQATFKKLLACPLSTQHLKYKYVGGKDFKKK